MLAVAVQLLPMSAVALEPDPEPSAAAGASSAHVAAARYLMLTTKAPFSPGKTSRE
jgi:hypothetical protein